MNAFLSNILSFPTVVYTVFLGVSCLYLLVANLGMVDLNIVEIDVDSDADVGALSGLMATLGLKGVPAPVTLTLLSLWGWVASFLAVDWLFFWDYSGLVRALAGCGVLIGAFFIAVFVTRMVITPLRPLFAKLYANPQGQQNLMGRPCIIRSGVANAEFGEATLVVDGAQLLIRVRYHREPPLQKGDRAVILERDDVSGAYLVISESEFNRTQS